MTQYLSHIYQTLGPNFKTQICILACKLVKEEVWRCLHAEVFLKMNVWVAAIQHAFCWHICPDNAVGLLGLVMILYVMFVWWRDIIRESTYSGHRTGLVQVALRYGIIFIYRF